MLMEIAAVEEVDETEADALNSWARAYGAEDK